MDEVAKLKQEIEKIKERNRKVEREKAWETSITRRLSVILLTYFVMVLVFSIIEVERPFINAVIPTLGYFLSTLSIGWAKQWWVKRK